MKFSPDFVWIKRRNSTQDHRVFDVIRGAEVGLTPNYTNGDYTATGELTAFNSDGYSLGTQQGVNSSGNTYVGWSWDAGSSNTTIAAGGLNSSLYDQSQTWSNSLTSSNGFWSGQGATKAFDGTGSSVTGTNNGGTLTLSLSLTIPANSTIQVRPSTQSGGYTVVVNGVSNSITGDSFHTVNYDGATTLTSITITSAGSSSADLKGIKINGALLTDTGVTLPNVPTIASTVRANPSAGFSVVTYTGNATAGATIGHGLGVAPEMIIIKNRDDGGTYWVTYHSSLGGTKALALNLTDSVLTNSLPFNNTNPTSTVFSVGGGGPYSYSNNQSSENHVAYCFAPVDGYSSAFSFTGTGADPGPFVYLGFKPKLILVKRTDNGNAASHWRLIDMTINPYNVADTLLYADSSAAELTEIWGEYDALSNGFRVMTPDSNQNASGGTYIGFAWAESPFKYARAR